MTSGSQWPHWISEARGERPRADRDRLEVWGYVGRPSYTAGETLTLHVSTTAERFSYTIFRDGGDEEIVHRGAARHGSWHDTPADAYAVGCGWPASVELEIPATWRPGCYVVEFTAADARGSVAQDGFFVLRPSVPGRNVKLAMLLATYTWQEYNDWGGASGYTRDAVWDGEAVDFIAEQRTTAGFSPRLSFERPWARGFVRLPMRAPRAAIKRPPPHMWATRYEQQEWAYANGYASRSAMAGWASYDGHFVRWAERSGYAVDVLTQWDLDREPGLLDPYRCVVTVGHDEYWTAAGRERLGRFVEGGGNYVRLAGNIFWQSRLEDGGRTLVCYKYAPDEDPLNASKDIDVRTGAFESRHINRPPITTFGGNGARGGFARFGGASPRNVGGFIVYRNDHWAFAGTDLYYGDVLGAGVPLVGYEVDGTTYTFKDGLPYPTGEDGAPEDLEILALTPTSLEEEDHGVWGSTLEVRDSDMAFVAQAIYGSDAPEHREKVRRGAAAMTWMRKGAGEVLCGASTEWPFALSEGDPMIVRIVRNAIDRFTAREADPPAGSNER
jgi:N,N-dimethylformamidase beta subunit-like protein